MIAAIKSEFLKLLSVRMTYIVSIAGFLLVGGLMSFYGMGWHDSAEGAQHSQYMEGVILANANFMFIFISIVALLIVTHEYRYNTIMHTLTSVNNRTKTFLAKIFVIGVFAAVVTALISIIGPLLALLAMSIKDVEMVPQDIPYLDLVWRCLFYGVANASAAAVIAFIIRNQVGAIATYFIVINTIEGLVGDLLLKHNAKWLPFTSVQHVVNVTPHDGSVAEGIAGYGYWSPPQAAILFSAYLITAGIVAWILFVRRDAN
jgi:hypothetical protein